MPTYELIRICTGYVLSKARRELSRLGYRVESARITGRTQELVEKTFIDGLESIGLSGVSENAGRRRFSYQLMWIHEDLKARERYVKTGWPSWSKKLRWSSQDGTESKK